jgi:hypothetical protein
MSVGYRLSLRMYVCAVCIGYRVVIVSRGLGGLVEMVGVTNNQMKWQK